MSKKWRDDPAHVGVDADVLRRPAARDDETGVALGLDLREREIGLDPPPRLLDVGVRVGLEVVDDGAHRAPRERRDVDLVAGLAQAVEDVEELEILDRVAGKDQHAFHAPSIAYARSGRSTTTATSGKAAATRNPSRHDVESTNGAKTSGVTATAAPDQRLLERRAPHRSVAGPAVSTVGGDRQPVPAHRQPAARNQRRHQQPDGRTGQQPRRRQTATAVATAIARISATRPPPRRSDSPAGQQAAPPRRRR